MKIDWTKLRKQKETLIYVIMSVPKEIAEDLDGILNLIDSIQDKAVEDGTATEEEVFGTDAIIIDIKTKRKLS